MRCVFIHACAKAFCVAAFTVQILVGNEMCLTGSVSGIFAQNSFTAAPFCCVVWKKGKLPLRLFAQLAVIDVAEQRTVTSCHHGEKKIIHL
jgi:hypothetical protein